MNVLKMSGLLCFVFFSPLFPFPFFKVARITYFEAVQLTGHSISQTYQRESQHVVTASSRPGTLTLLTSELNLLPSFLPLGEDFLWSQREDALQTEKLLVITPHS